MATRLEAARAKRAARAARKDASGYAQGNSTDLAEAGRAGRWQGLAERRATTRDLQAERSANSGAMLTRLFSKVAPMMALAVTPPPPPRRHRPQS